VDTRSRETCLESQVRGASQRQLRLLLIQGALRFARQTVNYWLQDNFTSADETADRCKEILIELLTSLQTDKSEIARRSAGVYIFLVDTLVQARPNRDMQKLQEVIRVLKVERDIWDRACQTISNTGKFGPNVGDEAGGPVAPVSLSDGTPAVPRSSEPGQARDDEDSPTGGFSVQA